MQPSLIKIYVWHYDAAGNRVLTTTNDAAEDYAVNNMNQYTAVGSAEYIYDEDGNLVSKIDGANTWTYQYDAENRLIAVIGTDGTWTYKYDALGNRVAVVANGVQTQYVVDPSVGNVVGEYNANGTPHCPVHARDRIGQSRRRGG